MTSRCCARIAVAAFVCFAFTPPAVWADDPGGTAASAASAHGYDYPTQGRVEYVLGCMDDNGHDFANVYKCSCTIDKFAAALPYDEFVEQSTFSKYATLGGEGGNEFRVDRARAQTKKFRAMQDAAYQACGLGKPTASAAK